MKRYTILIVNLSSPSSQSGANTVAYRAEYIWIDGTEPTAEVRSKTKVLADGDEPKNLGFDRSSTNQATGDNSDVVLQPVFQCGSYVGVTTSCNVRNPAHSGHVPHPTNTRAGARRVWTSMGDKSRGSVLSRIHHVGPTTGWPAGFPTGAPAPQGPTTAGGSSKIRGRELVEQHTTWCEAGLAISGTNAEVMPGQWEFQIGPADTVTVGDHLWMARYLLYRAGELHGLEISIEAKPERGLERSGYAYRSTNEMKATARSKKLHSRWVHLGNRKNTWIWVGIEDRLTGEHETQRFDQFGYGVSDRGASVRIPWQVARDGKGYLEDRRPNAMRTYVVATLITNTCCEALA